MSRIMKFAIAIELLGVVLLAACVVERVALDQTNPAWMLEVSGGFFITCGGLLFAKFRGRRR